jgi:tetratricopeptide (TPR) repeat protein
MLPENNRSDAVAFNNKGDVLTVLGFNEKALEYFDRAIKIDSNYAQAFCNKDICLHLMGNYRYCNQTEA